MVEAEAPPPAEGPVDEAPAGTIDETSEVPLKAPKRLPKPSRDECEAQTGALAAEINARKKRIEAINEAIKLKRSGGQSPEEQANRRAYSDLRASFKSALVSRRLLCF